MSPAARDFSVGRLAFRLDPATGMVRRVFCDGYEVLRGVYPAVRDAAWDTAPPAVTLTSVESSTEAVRITLSARVVGSAIDFTWEAIITAQAGGELTYDWTGRARQPLLTNRTGLCVLVPAEAAGAPCMIEHTDGRQVAGWLPQAIAPHQPFTAVRALTLPVAAGCEVTIRCEGETFEMEDQRNWSDASFKLYCRPLDWPRPYTVPAGATLNHRVSLRVRGRPPIRPLATGPGTLAAPSPTAFGPCPRPGFTLPGPVPPALRERLRALQPGHLRITTTPRDFAPTVAWAAPAAAACGCPLHVAIVGATTDAPDCTALPPQSRALLFDADGNAAPFEVLAAWHRRRPELAPGTGTVHHFTELNRQRPPIWAPHEFTAFGLNAQVHTFDDDSLLETLTQHGVLARHARTLGAGRPVAIGPIVLGPKHDSPDPRLLGPFGAIWTLGSLVQLAPVAAHLTYFATHGAAGVLQHGAVTPLEHLFLAVAGAGPVAPVAAEGLGPAVVYAVLLQSHGTVPARLLVANTGNVPVTLTVPWSGAAGVTGDQLAPFSAGTVTLPPRALWQLDIIA